MSMARWWGVSIGHGEEEEEDIRGARGGRCRRQRKREKGNGPRTWQQQDCGGVQLEVAYVGQVEAI